MIGGGERGGRGRGRGNGGPGVCRKCNKAGHYAKDCPDKNNPGPKPSKPSKFCPVCRQPGHSAASCPNKNNSQPNGPKPTQSGPNGPKPTQSGPQGSAVCHFCQQPGHKAANCPKKNNSKGPKPPRSPFVCHTCQQQGHKSADCPNKNNQNGPILFCNSCQQLGHREVNCPNISVEVDSFNKNDIVLFITKCSKLTDSAKISQQIKKSPDLWKSCWPFVAKNSPHRMALVTILTKARDASIPAPHLPDCCQVLVFLSEASTPKEVLDHSEIVMNALHRLLDFSWDMEPSEVKGHIEKVITKLTTNLAPHIASSDHRKMFTKVNTMIDDLEKPWAIKTTAPQNVVDPENPDSLPSWQTATIAWLSDEGNFNPHLLPRMKVPNDRFQGIYQDSEDYLTTLNKLWVGLTFQEGWKCLTPYCRSMQDGKQCGNPLTHSKASPKCHRCPERASYSCSNTRHNYGLCTKCLENEKLHLRSGPGSSGSTHIYDAQVTKVDWDGKIFVCQMKSRKPPQAEIHWRTTRRLCAPNLIGIVKLGHSGATLRLTDPIMWGEIGNHEMGLKFNSEADYRKKGQLMFKELSLNVNRKSFSLQPGQFVAIIDCQSFVPETVPILNALESQQKSPVPFENGALLNIAQATRDVETLTIRDDDDGTEILKMIDQSNFEPIVTIRRNPQHREDLAHTIRRLVKKATLDKNQFEAFLMSLIHPVHCTQGPPGTGKSYLGVVIVQALLEIRRMWMAVQPSIGAPPVLVLSYKNHAIDEFLSDLVKARSKVGLIRLGSGTSCQGTILERYCENVKLNADPEVRTAADKLKRLCALRTESKNYAREISRLNLFENQPDFPAYLHKMIILDEEITNYSQTYGHPTRSEAITLFSQTLRQFSNQYSLPSHNHSIQTLCNGVTHYKIESTEEILYMWMTGEIPRPQCASVSSCEKISEPGELFCSQHLCQQEECHQAAWKGKFCKNHTCQFHQCLSSAKEGQIYCIAHICEKCLQLNVTPAGLAEGVRLTCKEHPLCVAMDNTTGELCSEVANYFNHSYCEAHKSRAKCQAMIKGGVRCLGTPLSKENPFCAEHSKVPLNPQLSTEKCQGITKKKKPCQAKAIYGMRFCRAHGDQEAKIPAKQKAPLDSNSKPAASNSTLPANTAPVPAPNQQPVLAPNQQSVPAPNQQPVPSDPKNAPNPKPAPPQETEEIPVPIEEDNNAEDGERFDRDNLDEMELPDHLRDLHEVYQEEVLDEVEQMLIVDKAQEDAANNIPIPNPAKEEKKVVLLPPSAWTWEMTKEERWEMINAFISHQQNILRDMDGLIIAEINDYEKQWRVAKINANSRVYQAAEVLGGTIVGCVGRLDAIRATKPFAILVEEASEVLEPLLFGCIVSSTCKLEMIGDHRQLQPSLMGKFDFEKISKMNISMFERLICSPSTQLVPSTVLSIQRRMRKNICDLTREFYSDITKIQDHEVCSTKRIISFETISSDPSGREIPGILPHVFFWSHSHRQEKASVGLSRQNSQEAEMAVSLVRYMVNNGVPKTAIAVLTPYKGQLMLIKKMLENQRLYSPAFKRMSDTCRISTVDRFQGDESDIVIISLVIDENSRTAFVKLQNRMVVLLSRARLGMFILGNEGYFASPDEHWKKTFDLLKKPSLPDPKAPGCVYHQGARIGTQLPICCPQHRAVHKPIKAAKDLKLGFCQEICNFVRPQCGHECGYRCHWPAPHDKPCLAVLESPCIIHPRQLKCPDIMKSNPNSLQEALQEYECDVSVTAKLPCQHEKAFPCYQYQRLILRKQSWPICTQTALSPYIYEECKHPRVVTCHQLAQIQNGFLRVPVCDYKVPYIPACGHQVKIPCHEKKLYVGGTQFHCQEKVYIHLPRCHHAAQVLCTAHQLITNWNGKSSTDNLVEEGVAYGMVDHPCKTPVSFKLKCGHVMSQVPCEIAFEYAHRPPKCVEEVEMKSPICGHMVKVPCHVMRAHQNIIRNAGPVTLVKSEETGRNQANPIFTNTHLNHLFKCQKQVTVQHPCQHEEQVACWKAQAPASCQKSSTHVNPLCGHKTTVSCQNLAPFQGWKPWTKEDMSSLQYDKLREGIVYETFKRPDVIRADIFPACKEHMTLERTCGHKKQISCSQIWDPLQFSRFVTTQCSEKVVKKLKCGHKKTLLCFDAQKETIECSEKCQKQCWNWVKCNSLVQTYCSDPIPKCGASVEWTCPKGHSRQIRQCQHGTPQDCPQCQIDLITNEMKSTKIILDLPLELRDIKSIKQLKGSDQIDFLPSKEHILESHLQYRNQSKVPNYFLSSWTPCFILDNPKAQSTFEPGPLAEMTDYGWGVQVSVWSRENITRLMEKGSNVTLLFGYCYNTQVLINPPLPSKKRGKPGTFVIQNMKNGFSCAFNTKTLKMVAWDPFCLYATHKVELSVSSMEHIVNHWRTPSLDLSSKPIQFTAPTPLPEHLQIKRESKKNPAPDQKEKGHFIDSLNNTEWSGVLVADSWKGSIGLEQDIQSQIQKKVHFLPKHKNESDNPFSGTALLQNLIQDDPNPELKLMLALEYAHLDYSDEARPFLQQYADSFKNAIKAANPLFLLALARIEKDPLGSECLYHFCSYPASKEYLHPDELKMDIADKIQHSASQDLSVSDEWKFLKSKENCHSKAMDTLLSLTGLKKVKEQAIKFFKNALSLQKMEPSARAKNAGSFSFNFIFAGNPGTGKTTVARLFGKILKDAQVRSSGKCIECTAQEAKDDGPDKFRKTIASAMNGVLFIDEAYELDPKGDFQGKPIVSEILTASENLRDKLSFILAGYEDDIRDKLYAYNDGLKSRFHEIIFEDFDENELKSIWQGILKDKEWACGPDVSRIAAQRLAKRAGRKGFGNARDVRKMAEQAISAAMAREGWNGTLHLQTRDIVGDSPFNNPKLEALLEKVDSMTGWKRVKSGIQELLDLAEKNYQRELEGQPPLPFSLNRLFLGNPGTGKTTCAVFYGQILKLLNILSIGEVVSKTASDFVGNVVGESQTKTNQILSGAQGKVLLIDEAYVLNDSTYGKQVLDTLVEKIQGGPNDDIAVLLLGYEEQMLTMIRECNPGLARRFPQSDAFYFDDYTEGELLKIWQDSVKKQNIKCPPQVASEAIRLLASQKSQPNFGNAGAVNRLLQNAMSKASSRSKASQQIVLSRDDLLTAKQKEDAQKDPFDLLKPLYNVDGIRQKLVELKARLTVAQREGDATPSVGHFVFLGSPGTGKTTIARIISKIFYQLELIPSDRCEETSGLNLTGDFLGQTKTKVTEALDKANGGVLFIDEAYELGKSMYGEEAMTTLLAAMTSDRYKRLVIVIAGYEKEIHQMLNRNPGLKSRFSNFFHFEDWTEQDCLKFFSSVAVKESFQLETQANDILLEGFRKLRTLDGWANARDVHQIWKNVLTERAQRVVAAPEKTKSITKTDIFKAFENMLKQRNVHVAPPATLRQGQAQSQNRETKPPVFTPKIEEKQSEPTPKAQQEQIPKDGAQRDAGVSDAIWKELEKAKKEYFDRLARERSEEEKRIEEEKAAAIREKIRKICPCPAGYNWYPCGGGWRCGGGSHFVSDAQLMSQFSG